MLSAGCSGPYLIAGPQYATLRPGCDWSAGPAGCERYNNKAKRFAFDHLPDKTTSIPVLPEPASAEQTDPNYGAWN